MSAATNLLQAENIHVWLGDRHVLQGVNLELREGQLMHVWGPNGTGKTTLMRVICGLLHPEQGVVRWCGRPIAEVKGGYYGALAYASHEPALKSDLTPLENLRYAVGLKRRVAPQELRASLEHTGVAACAELPTRVLSAGQRRRVSMARVLAMRAALWVLDEPFTNLDAAGSRLMSQLLEEHVRAGGLALVVAHHDLNLELDVRRLELTA